MKKTSKHLLTFALLALFCVMSQAASAAEGWDEALYKQIESRIVAPTFKNKTYNIKKFGASEKATAAKNQQAINKAIEKCSQKGGGTVVVPAGTFLTGAIRMQSNVNLRVEKGATILFAYEPDLYPLVKTRWEGLDLMNYSACIYAYQAQNIAISGEGIIDGNGENETWWQWCGAKKFGFNENTPQAQSMPYFGNDKWG